MYCSGSKDRISRREFLKGKGIRSKRDVIPIVNKEECTGCGLCTTHCPTKALTLSQKGESDTYQILFRQETCNACGVCEKSCPENCLQMIDQEPVEKKTGEEGKVIFEDKISKCTECGIPLFPKAMLKKLESKIFMTKEHAWPFHLCPSCRTKSQFKNEGIRNIRF